MDITDTPDDAGNCRRAVKAQKIWLDYVAHFDHQITVLNALPDMQPHIVSLRGSHRLS